MALVFLNRCIGIFEIIIHNDVRTMLVYYVIVDSTKVVGSTCV